MREHVPFMRREPTRALCHVLNVGKLVPVRSSRVEPVRLSMLCENQHSKIPFIEILKYSTINTVYSRRYVQLPERGRENAYS